MTEHIEIFDKLPDGVTLHDPADGSIIQANDQFCELLGYTRTELRELDFDDLHPNEPPYTTERAEEYIRKAATEGPQTFEWMDVTKAGEPLPVEVNLRFTSIEGEERVLAVVRDISDRKEREEELRQTSRRLNLALEATDTGVWEWDMETGEVVWSETLERLLGIEPGSFAGTYEAHEDYLHLDDIPVVERAAENALQGDGTFDAEFRMIREDGEQIWVKGRGQVFTENGSKRMIGTTTDITERKEHEQELARQNERLDKFASMVSHDLRSPLNIAEGRLQLAIEDRDWEALDGVAQALDRMETLIEDFLTLARAGETVGETESVELAALTEASWRGVDTESAELNIETDSVVQADESRLQQLLENLIRNAAEHGGNGVTVTIGDLESGFYVEDDGQGIPLQKRDDVLASGYSTQPDGTGLGLEIVQEIAKAHGWDITLTDSEDGGARFEFTGVEVL